MSKLAKMVVYAFKKCNFPSFCNTPPNICQRCPDITLHSYHGNGDVNMNHVLMSQQTEAPSQLESRDKGVFDFVCFSLSQPLKLPMFDFGSPI